MVPFSLLEGACAADGGEAPNAVVAAAGFTAAPGGGGTGVGDLGDGGWFISIVPLNFGAAAPFRLKLHLLQVCAVSGFWVPQFGQNTRQPPWAPKRAARGKGPRTKGLDRRLKPREA
jgi:hypothetical protein